MRIPGKFLEPDVTITETNVAQLWLLIVDEMHKTAAATKKTSPDSTMSAPRHPVDFLPVCFSLFGVFIVSASVKVVEAH
jgi:hypothetical protein